MKFPGSYYIINYMENKKKVEVGDIVNVKGEEWGMYVISVEGEDISCVELDLILDCKIEDIEFA